MRRSTEHLGGVARVQRPLGGGHLWLTLPERIDERDLYEEAVAPGRLVPARRGDDGRAPPPAHARLSFGYLDPPELREGVKRLAAAIRAVGRASRQREALPVA